MYKEINRIENISGNVLRHSDTSSTLKFKFRNEAGESIAIKSVDIAHIRINNYSDKSFVPIIDYSTEGDSLLFNLPADVAPGTYYLEIKTVDGQYYPANDETKIILKQSSLSSEQQKVTAYGFDNIVTEVIDKIDIDNHLVDTTALKAEVINEINYDPVLIETNVLNKVPLDKNVYNVLNHGAKGDGVTNDREAIQELINQMPEGSILYFPSNPHDYIIDYVLFVTKKIIIRGDSYALSRIKVANNSTLFHNPNRDNDDRNKQSGYNLFRDFHSVFFFVDCDISLHNLQIDGNPEGQQDIVNGVTWNYVGPSIGDKSRNYYKYYHLVQAQYNRAEAHTIDIQGCFFHGGTWNNVVLNNNAPVRNDLLKIRIFNNIFEGSAQDMLSMHFVGNWEVKANKFLNPNSHCAHSYFDTNKGVFDSNYFLFTDDVNCIAPNRADDQVGGRVLEAVRFGHGVYKSHIKDQMFTNNVIEVRTDLLNVYAVNISNTTTNIIIENNVMKNVTIGIFAPSVMLGNPSIRRNSITHKQGGIIHRVSDNNGVFLGVPSDVSTPVSTNIDLTDNAIKRIGTSTLNADIVVNKPNYNEAELKKYSVTLLRNQYDTIITDKSIKYEIKETSNCGTQNHNAVVQIPYTSDRKLHDVVKFENNPANGQTDAYIYVDIVDSRRGLIQDVVKVAFSGNDATVTRENVRGDSAMTSYTYSVVTNSMGLNTLQVNAPALSPSTLKYTATSRTHRMYSK